MVTVSNTKTTPPRPISVLVHGRPKAGKTTFASTSPKPVFIVPEQDRGLSSLEGIPTSFDYIVVNSPEDMDDAGKVVANEYKKRGWGAVVIDPFTTYTFVADLVMQPKFKGADRRQYYGILRQHLLNVWRMFQGIPLHTIWVCHSNEAAVDTGDDETTRVELRPACIGSAIDVIEANVDLIFYAEKRIVEVDQGPLEEGQPPRKPEYRSQFSLWLRCPPNMNPQFRCGGRFEEKLTAYRYKPDWGTIMKHLRGEKK